MIIRFFDGDDLRIGDDRGEQIKRLITEGAEWLEVDGAMYRVSGIKALLPSKPDYSRMIGGTAKPQARYEALRQDSRLDEETA